MLFKLKSEKLTAYLTMQFCGGKNVPSVRSFRYILQGPKGHSLGQGVVDKLTKLSKIDFSVECFTAYFFSIFYRKTSKFDIWRGEWELAIKSKYSRIFLEIFYFFFLCGHKSPPSGVHVVAVLSFCYSLGNSYFHSQMIII